eukprot:1153266-Pelagomonas_calceolata.AAC.4
MELKPDWRGHRVRHEQWCEICKDGMRGRCVWVYGMCACMHGSASPPRFRASLKAVHMRADDMSFRGTWAEAPLAATIARVSHGMACPATYGRCPATYSRCPYAMPGRALQPALGVASVYMT